MTLDEEVSYKLKYCASGDHWVDSRMTFYSVKDKFGKIVHYRCEDCHDRRTKRIPSKEVIRPCV